MHTVQYCNWVFYLLSLFLYVKASWFLSDDDWGHTCAWVSMQNVFWPTCIAYPKPLVKQMQVLTVSCQLIKIICKSTLHMTSTVKILTRYKWPRYCFSVLCNTKPITLIWQGWYSNFRQRWHRVFTANIRQSCQMLLNVLWHSHNWIAFQVIFDKLKFWQSYPIITLYLHICNCNYDMIFNNRPYWTLSVGTNEGEKQFNVL